MAVSERAGAAADQEAKGGQPVAAPRPPRVRHFARLKLRVLGNGLRGRPWRIVLFVLGCLFGLEFAGTGFVLFAVPALGGAEAADVALFVAAGGGAALVLGWLLMPLVFFGVDETLDPARFALLPLPRRTLVAGLLTAGLVGIPAVATAIATLGTVVPAAATGGWVAALVQVLGVAAGVLLCVAVSRAVTSAFATTLRSRRTRDLAAVLLAVLAASIGPLEIAVIATVDDANPDRLVDVARVLQWTPLGAPWTTGLDVAQGRPLFALVKLLGTGLVIWGLLAWWARSLESAMVGASGGGARRRTTATADGAAPTGAVAQLMPRALGWLRPDRGGALVAREVRYWWRDARRRAGLITVGIVGVFLSVVMNVQGLFGGETRIDPSPFTITMSMLFVGALAALSLANQFGYDGNAYAANVVAGVPGRVELAARVVGFSVYIVPLTLAMATTVALVFGRPEALPAMLGALAAAYGAGLAVNLVVSIFGAYALPETSNPFAVTSGVGMAKGMLAFVALLATLAAAAPFAAAAALLGTAWNWLALPVGLLYGVGAVLLGCYICGDALDRRGPELLAAVTPRR